MNPGQIAFTGMLALPHSRAAVRVMDRMPALDAPYAPVCSEDTSPPTDDQLMIEPPPLSTMAGIAYFIPRKTLLRLLSLSWSYSASPTAGIAALAIAAVPAQLCQRSGPPCR